VGLFGGPDAAAVLAKGEPSLARIVGIDVSYVSDGDSDRRVEEYALALADGRTIGVRQALRPPDQVRLGMEVPVQVLGDRAVITWGEVETHRHKALKAAPSPGIVDRQRDAGAARKKGVPARVTLTAIDRRSFLGGLASRLEATVTVEPEGIEPYEAEIKGLEVAPYASHLAEVGRPLPGWVTLKRLDRPVIDWAAAATADPGVGRPPVIAEPLAPPTEVASVDQRPVREQVEDAASSGLHFGGLDLATYAAIEAGLQTARVPPAEHDAYARSLGAPAGTVWADAVAAWQAAIRSDWRVGAAFGEAVEAARKDAKRRR
ncbi:MAG: hypothetical protein KDA94_13355, partial [Acidimicrobiales bacterium]|nr:hypothetical protein [Acidimicrobiales bacterium]